MRATILGALAAAASLGAVGCGSRSLSFDKAPAELARANCRTIFSCCSPDEAAALAQGATDEASCVTQLSATFMKGFGELQPSVADGSVRYDGARAAACVDQIRGASCPDFLEGRSTNSRSCDGIFVGTLADGAACASDDACLSRYCAGGAGAGTCQALPRMGAACPDHRCAGGLYCDASATCQPVKADGAACQANAECEHAFCDKGSCATPPLACTLPNA